MRMLLFAFLLTGLISAGESRRPLRTMLRVAATELDPPLDRTAFKATLDGSPAKVLRVRGPADDLVLLVVLDLTGDLALVDNARRALKERLGGLPNNNWVGLLKAQDVLQVVQDPTPDRDKIATAIDAYAATGKPGLLTTIESAAAIGDSLLKRSDVRVAVVYVTDSDIRNYREDFTNPVINATDSRDLSRKFPDQLIREKMQKLSDALSALETPLFLIHLTYFSDPINEAYQRGLMQLAEESGGRGEFCRSRGEIPEAVDKVISAASTHWSVTVELGTAKARTANIDLWNGDRDVPNRARFSLRK